MESHQDYQQELRERDIRQKQLDTLVQAAVDAVASAVANTPPPLRAHLFYGLSAIDPRHLATWFIFRTDAEYEEARSSGLAYRIDELTRAELLCRGYPAEVIPEVYVSFTTDETVQREAGGNYWPYFK